MPGWASRTACSWIISLARSRTAASTRSFLAGPAGAAELRQFRLGLAAADVLLDQVDLRRRHVDPDAVAEFEDQVFFFATEPEA